MFFATIADAQSFFSPDSLLREIPGKKITCEQDLEYSPSFSNFLILNQHHDKNAHEINLLQNLKFRFSISGDSLVNFSLSFLHNLGFQIYFDSLTKIKTDDNTLNTRFDIRIYKNLNFSINSILTSRLTNGYDYSIDDSGRLVRILNSSFCTPLICIFSGGLSVRLRDFGSLSLGASTAKLTYVRDKSIFGKQNVSIYYGVPDGKDHLFQYGLSLQFLAEKEFLKKRIKWNCDLLAFKNYTSPVNFTLKNNVAIRISRFLNASIQTRVCYEETVSRNIQLENLVVFGFYFHL